MVHVPTSHEHTVQYKRVASQWPVWIFLQYAASLVERSLVGYLAKLAGQILLHGRSQTGLASLCSLLSSSGCRALQGIPVTDSKRTKTAERCRHGDGRRKYSFACRENLN
jgi:hypothetical protein